MSNYKDTGEKSDESTSDVDASLVVKHVEKALTLDRNSKNIPIELHKRKDTHFLFKLSHISLVSLKIAKYHFRFYVINSLGKDR
jgi:hypothetical protein